jgi:hypothetical protein
MDEVDPTDPDYQPIIVNISVARDSVVMTLMFRHST